MKNQKIKNEQKPLVKQNLNDWSKEKLQQEVTANTKLIDKIQKDISNDDDQLKRKKEKVLELQEQIKLLNHTDPVRQEKVQKK